MSLFVLVALAVPFICLALLSLLGFFGVLTLGLVLHVVSTFMARMLRIAKKRALKAGKALASDN